MTTPDQPDQSTPPTDTPPGPADGGSAPTPSAPPTANPPSAGPARRDDDPPAWVEELRTSIGALPESIANAMREATSAVTPPPTATGRDEKSVPADTESDRPKASPRPKARPKAESVPNEPAPGQSFRSWWFGR